MFVSRQRLINTQKWTILSIDGHLFSVSIASDDFYQFSLVR